MLDSREGNVAKNEMNREFNGKPLWQRFCIVLAGPVFNFILAIILYTVIYTVGVQGLKPIIGEVESSSMGAKSGFVAKQEIVSVNGIITPTWSNVVDSLVSQTVSGDTAKITVKDIDGIQKSVYLDLSRISIDEIADGKLLKKIGIVI